MSTIVDKLSADLSNAMLDQIKSTLFPLIVEKYNIPMSDLEDILAGSAGTQTVESSPAPKKAAARKPSQTISEKITSAQAQSKFFNVSTGRPIIDSAANRKKFKFYDELGIAGAEGDIKLQAVVKSMTGSSVGNSLRSSTASIAVTETAGGGSVKKAVRQKKAEPIIEEPEEDHEEQETPQEDSEEQQEETPQDSEEQQEETPQEDSEEQEEATPKAVQVLPPAETPQDKPKEKEPEPPKVVPKIIAKPLKQIQPIEKPKPVKVPLDAKLEPPAAVSGLPIKIKYNTKIKSWWNEETNFITKRDGKISVVTGKFDGTQIVKLSADDISFCQERGWPFIE